MRPFYVARAALAALVRKEQDIPEVEIAKRLVMPIVKHHWDVTVKQAVQDIVDTFSGYQDDVPSPGIDAVMDASREDRAREDLIAALILSMYLLIERRMSTPAAATRLAVIRDAINALLRAGGRSVSDSFPFGRSRGVNVPTVAEGELHLLLGGRVVTHRSEIEALLRAALTDRSMRRDAARGGGALVTGLEAALGTPAQEWTQPVVDQWAYSTFNVGAAVAAIEDRVQTLYVWNNPPKGPDKSTTPFCHWAHGKPVAIADVVRKLGQVTGAVNADDFVALRFARPLSPPSDSAGFSGHLKACVLPAYHFGCRSVVMTRPPG